MKKKFKVGDKVKIVKKYGTLWEQIWMDKTIGETGTITTTRGPRLTYYVKLSPGRGYYYDPRSLELVPEKSPQIPLPIKREFKIGDTVRICRMSGKVIWSEAMKDTIGVVGVVGEIIGIKNTCIHVRFDKYYGNQDSWYYHTDDLEHPEEVKTKEVSLVETVKQLKEIIEIKDKIISTLEDQIKQVREIVQIEL